MSNAYYDEEADVIRIPPTPAISGGRITHWPGFMAYGAGRRDEAKDAQSPIVITKSEHGYVVFVGNKWSGPLCADETLGMLAHLLVGEDWPGKSWLRDWDGHKDDAIRHAEKMKELDASRAREAADAAKKRDKEIKTAVRKALAKRRTRKGNR